MPQTAKPKENYQDLSRQLDALLLKLQDGETGIDDAVKYYEEALKLIAKLEGHLEKAENHVHELKAQFGDGK
jgi:exodeoxyribonuclease VII small subunit